MRRGCTRGEGALPPRRTDAFDRLWTLLSSTRLALGLILAIAAACLAGALVAQAPNELLDNADAVRTWVERMRPRYGVWTDLLHTIGLFWVVQTVWFSERSSR